MSVTLYHGDCLEILPTLKANSIDLIATDPPYYKVKALEWDRQWDTPEEYLAWLDQVLEQFERVLKPNGSLYLFASPQMAARVECLVGERFDVLNSIRWYKEAGWHKKAVPDALRSYLTPWEAVIFAEHFNSDNRAKGETNYQMNRTGPTRCVGSDVQGYDIGGRVSPSCPEHGGLYALAYMALCDVHADDGLSRIENICNQRVQEPVAFGVSNDLTDDAPTNSDSLDSFFRECFGFANCRSTKIRKMVRAFSTCLPNWEDEITAFRIECTLAQLGGHWIYRDISENNKPLVCLAARQWLENPCHTVDTAWFSVSCTCPSPRIISHFAGKHKSGEQQYKQVSDELRGFVFEPLRAYLDSEWKRAGLSFEDARQAVGCAQGSGLPSHWFTRSQWILPTEAKYHQLRQYANAHNHNGEYLRREYEDLRRDYEDLRREYEDLRREYEDLRRPFYATPERPYTDVWTFPTVQSYPGKHPCEKPLEMMEHIVLTSSRPGAVVLDAFMGHATTGVACVNTGRNFVGIERGAKDFEASRLRIGKAQAEMIQLQLA